MLPEPHAWFAESTTIMLNGIRRKPSPTAAAIVFAIIAAISTSGVRAQCVIGVNAGLEIGVGGASFANVPSNTLFGGLADFTIECWFLRQPTFPSNGGANMFQTILNTQAAFGSGVRPVWLGFINTPSSQLYFAINWNPANGSFYEVRGSGGPYADGNWHHVAIVRIGSNISIYVDGQIDPISQVVNAGVVPSALLSSNPQPITFGASSATQFPLFGHIDEARIWNLGRSQSEIAATMNVGLNGNEPGLVGYWRFDEGSGQTVFNSAAATGSALDGTLGANALPGTDDPTWITTGLPPLPYCPPCPTPPCGQVNSPCATLTVNGVGAAAQGPFNVVVPPAGTLALNWSGPPNQPYVLVATTNLIPGQLVSPPSFVVDVNIGNYFLVYSGFDPVFGPLYFTNAAGTSGQTWTHPGVPLGVTMNVQGLMYDLAFTCGSGLPFMTTASFAIQL
jgi:hypothetical protein